MTNVAGKIELIVVNPDRRVHAQRDLGQALAVTRSAAQPVSDVLAELRKAGHGLVRRW
jgi:hypothetical protein